MTTVEILNLILTGAVAIATALLFVATRHLVKGGEDTARKDLRAYVAIELDNMAIGLLTPEVPVWTRVMLKNYGKTPAFGVRHVARYAVLPMPLPDSFQIDEPTTNADSHPFVLHPLQSRESTTDDTGPLTDGDLQLLGSGRYALYIFGVATYTDIYRHQHKTTSLVYVSGSAVVSHRKQYAAGNTAAIPDKWRYANRHNDAD